MLFIRLPGNVFFIDCKLFSILFADERRLKLIREEALGDEATWVGGLFELFVGESLSTQTYLLVVIKVLISRDRIALFDLRGTDVVPIAHELLVRARFDISPMVLIKVVELIVHIHWSRDLFLDLDFNGAIDFIATKIVVLFGDDLDILAHNVEQDAKRQENYPKDAENDHCGAERGHRPPRRQLLLLELAFSQLVNLIFDSFFLFVSFFLFR